jgi:penicillin amidase
MSEVQIPFVPPKFADRSGLTFRASRVAAMVSLAALLWLGARGAGPLPPLGPLLEPVGGVWGLAASSELPTNETRVVPGLIGAVRIAYDARAVPHIFAESEQDGWRALGYVTARDRLFQLDLQARAGAGTLTELLGPRVLGADRATRALGMGRAAQRILAGMSTEERATLDAYAEGINAYLDGMPARDLPLEYRLLNRRPSHWSAERSVHVMLRMQHTLTRNQVELDRLRAAGSVGWLAAEALFPLHTPLQEPVQPAPGEPRRLQLVIPPPGAPDSTAREFAGLDDHPPLPPETVAIGSNNWAVAPSRTLAGTTLLAGDPHLDLTLPSVWYEARVHVVGVVDVYGVTIPGLPAVLVGFNRDVAWSFTNSEADLMDRWVEAVDDERRPARYRLDGTWAPITTRVEAYLGAQGDTLAMDTVRYTHRGPMRRLGARWISTRWTALESGGELEAIHHAARARTVRAWLDAMVNWRSPPQNMLVADREGTIAVRTNGRFPLRAGDGRGDHLLDGRLRASDWTGDVPLPDWPQSVEPAQGFLVSANQEPVDPRMSARYLGAAWPVPWRALRINELLRSDSAVTPETLRRWQTDPLSARARHLRPYLLAAALTRPADTALQHAARVLGPWDTQYTLDNQAGVLFEAAIAQVASRLWDELAPDVRPGAAPLIALLDDPNNAWWDVRSTAGVEHRDDVLADALLAGYVATVAAHGPPERGGWRWSRVHQIVIEHLLRIPALSAQGVIVPGGPSTISPTEVMGSTAGASWRMVVELGPTVRAWGTYPGGQSGNPLSTRYDDRLSAWRRGELAELQFPANYESVAALSRLRLQGQR